MSNSTPASAPAAHPLLIGPILPTLVQLAVPNVVAMVLAVLVSIAETWTIGRLGTVPLAAMALVFPFAMLTGMMSAGAMGGGVSSAVSRALGGGDILRANTLAFHALVIGTVAGLLYTAVFLLFGPVFYGWLGGQGDVLQEAARYSDVLFAGALLVWLSNTLASVVRGTGNMRVPSLTIILTSILQIPLGIVLGLGIGSFEGLGMVGVALGHIIATGAGVVYFLWFLMTGRGRLTLALRGVALQREMLIDILKVGAVALASPLQSVLAVLIFTGLVARLGVEALAGYSIGQRLEFLLIPISFGIGVAAVPMVGMAMGAGQVARARQVAWTAGRLSAFNLAVVGIIVALFPDLWAGLFSREAAVLDHARQYLRIVGPAFAFFGLGLTLYFASQGSGKILGPVLASSIRLVLVAGVGWWLAQGDSDASAYFGLVAAAMVLYGISTVLAVRWTRWGK